MVSTPSRSRASTLPVSLTSLVGRVRELAAVQDLLRCREVRLVTLTGPGGVGKTRLALGVAAGVGEEFVDGVEVVSLAPITESALVEAIVAESLGLVVSGDDPVGERLSRVIGSRRVLLVLDNFEQVVEAAPFVGSLLAHCPALTTLVTSREPLRIQGELEFSVSPLALPDRVHTADLSALATGEAVSLFLQRARAVSTDFALTPENAAAVAEVCARLDGLPLAIELAAAWIKVLSPGDLVGLMTDRLSLLTRTSRDRPPRHRTMSAAIAWSYDLLSPDEQALFRRLAVFPGGFTLDAADAVSRESGVGSRELDGVAPVSVLAGVMSLVDKSLVRRVGSHDGTPRFAMYETIRAFGLQELAATGEVESVRRRLVAWCLALAERSYPELLGPAMAEWLDRLEAEHDNVRTALAWTLERGDAETAQRLTGGLARFWNLHGHVEGRGWTERALALSGQTPPAVRAKALCSLGFLAWGQGDYQHAASSLRASLAIWEEIGDTAGIAQALWRLGIVAEDRGTYDEATAFHEQALALFRDLGDRIGTAYVLNALGVVAYERGDIARAEELLDEAMRGFRELGNAWGLGLALVNLGRIARARGDFAQASVFLAESLALHSRRPGQKVAIAMSLRGLASVAALTGHFERAARLFGAAEALRASIDAPVPRHNTQTMQSLQRARVALGEQAFGVIWETGRTLPLAEAIAEALATPADVTVDAATGFAPARAYQFGLTRKEVEVLRLLREGLTNREIGERLFISPRTAQTHVHNIMAKLEVGSRTAAATYAVERGIV